MAETLYQVRIRDTSGAQTAILYGGGRGTTGGGLQAFSYRKRVRTPGAWWVQIAGDDDRLDDLQLDAGLNHIWEFWRRDPSAGLDWYRDFSGLHRHDRYQQDKEGRITYTARGRGLNDLLLGEPIRYDKGTAEAAKSAPCETVAKEYVNENLGPGAPATRQLADFTVQADAATGVAWEGDRANEQLVDVLVELAELAPGDYNVVDLSEANDTPAFQFQWQAGQWGLDRREGNGVNVPCVFTARLNNLTDVDYLYSRLDEANVCYVVGQGVGTLRRDRTRTATDAGFDATWEATKWARRAVVRTTRDYADAAMDDKADETLWKQRIKPSFSFRTNNSPNTRYGRDWNWGDVVSVEYRAVMQDQKIVGVIVGVGSSGEITVKPEMEAFVG